MAVCSTAEGHHGATPLHFSRAVQILPLESSGGDQEDFTAHSSDKLSPAEEFPEP